MIETINTDPAMPVSWPMNQPGMQSTKDCDEETENKASGKDIAIVGRLLDKGHWSCAKHVAKAVDTDEYIGNFQGFRQYRKCFPPEFESRRGNLHELRARYEALLRKG